MNIQDALQNVIDTCPNAYAVAYATEAMHTSLEDLPGQLLYVLSNTGSWRGPLAKESKIVLREVAN